MYWLGEASAVLLADDLNALGRRAYTREERLEAFEQLQMPAAASLSHATVIRLGQVVGATHVVIGSFTLTGSQIVVKAQNIRLDSGRMENEVVESGSLESLFAIFERVSRRVAGATAQIARSPGRPNLQVFEQYIKGLIASATSAKVSYLESAIKVDSGFRSRAAGIVGRPPRRRERTGGARGGRRGPGDIADVRACAILRRVVADSAQAARRRVCDASNARRPLAFGDGDEQPRCDSNAAPGDAGNRPRDVLFQPGAEDRSRRPRLLLQSRLCVLGGEGCGRRPSSGCAKRSAGIPPMAKRMP